MKGKTIVITGSTSGIGKACAWAFAEAGGTVVVSGRDESRLREAEQQLRARGARVAALRADVSVPADCRRLVDTALKETGRIDVLINNAGLTMRASFASAGFEVLKELMDTNFWGAVYCTQYALPALLESRGSVVGISSIAGKQGLPGRTGYSASKFALEGFLQALRIEYMNKGLHVLVACPGFTASRIRYNALTADGTKQGETPREEQKMMHPDEVAKHILRAVRQRRRDLVLTAEGKATVWLNRLFPGWVDRMVYRKLSKEKNAPF